MASCGERAAALLAAACRDTDALLPLPLPHTRALKQRPQRKGTLAAYRLQRSRPCAHAVQQFMSTMPSSRIVCPYVPPFFAWLIACCVVRATTTSVQTDSLPKAGAAWVQLEQAQSATRLPMSIQWSAEVPSLSFAGTELSTG